MYQFIDDTLYRRRPNGVKLKCICWEEGRNYWQRYTRACVAPTLNQEPWLEKLSGKVSTSPQPSKMQLS